MKEEIGRGMLELREVYKKYGNKEVLKGINMKLEHGVYGLLGVNGAGKTTLINILTGILEADSGNVFYHGKDIHNKKSNFHNNLGFMPQYTTFYPDFTAYEFLKYMCVMKAIPKKEQKKRIEELLEKVNLTKHAKEKIGNYSGGMRQRVGIAQALLNYPEILVLDEPTAGLDPAERIRFRNLISNLGEEHIVILATHIVQDVEYIANQVLLLHDGRIVAQGKPKELLDKLQGQVGILKVDSSELEQATEQFVISNLYCEKDSYHIKVVAKEQEKINFQPVTPNLEDFFLSNVENKGEKN